MKYKKNYRKEGVLSGLSRDTIPQYLLFFDTETFVLEDGNNLVDFPFRLGVAIFVRLDSDGNIKYRDILEFKTEQEFIDYTINICPKRSKLLVFAHNISFDLRVLNAFDKYFELDFVSEPPIINNMVFIWTIKKNKQKIEFLDTANFGIRTVEQLGDDMGYEKMEIDFNTATDQELFEYCLRDVEILEKFILNYIWFIRDNSLGAFKVTLASQSLTAFRTSFMSDNIYIHMQNGSITLERDGYYGGRTECFRLGYLGQSKYYYLDINSMYPHAMINYPLPAELKTFYKDVSYDDFIEYMSEYYCIADVTIETDINAYPLRLTNKKKTYNYLHNPNDLEYPDKSNSRLIFPVGRFRTTLHDLELRHALAHSKIVEIHRLSTFTTNNPFNDYVHFFYDAKNHYGQEGNKTWRLIAKLFLNSLYGKFGQLMPHRYFNAYTPDIEYFRLPDYDTDEEQHYTRLYWQFREYIEFKKGETAFSNPALAGAITANARIYLFELITQAGKKNVFYTDTDSLIVNQEGYDNLLSYIDNDKIGALGLEQTARRLVIYGNKDYRIDGKVRHKGVSPKSKKTGHNNWRYLQFQGFVSWLNDKANNKMIGSYNTKSRRGVYMKGIVSDNGIILPYHLQE